MIALANPEASRARPRSPRYFPSHWSHNLNTRFEKRNEVPAHDGLPDALLPAHPEILSHPGSDYLRQSPVATRDGALLRHLDDLLDRGAAQREIITSVVELWTRLSAHFQGSLTLPQASPTEDEGFLLAWPAEEQYFEIEAVGSGIYDWLARNRVEDTFRGEDGLSLEDAAFVGNRELSRLFD